MNRWDVINYFISKYNYKSYLEIGYYKGWSFDRVKCDEKTAIDPNPSKTPEQEAFPYGQSIGDYGEPERIFKMTSDEAFKIVEDSRALGNQTKKWDIIFIDGLHEREQVLKDLKNSFNSLADNGIIIMHDCNPPKYEHTTTGIDGCWTGDVYKAALDLRLSPEADMFVIDDDWGVGVVKPRRDLSGNIAITESDHFNALFDWNFFDQNRKQLLNIISVSEFLAKEREKENDINDEFGKSIDKSIKDLAQLHEKVNSEIK